MVSVSIFALRDVIRKVQKEYTTPFNSKSHTSPSTVKDLQTVCDYLKSERIQTYFPNRENNTDSIEARDLIQVGAAYANKATAFQNFKHVKYNLKNLGIPGSTTESHSDREEEVRGLIAVADSEDCDIDLGSDSRTELDDLLLDEDEYPLQSDIGDYIATVGNILDEFDRYE